MERTRPTFRALLAPWNQEHGDNVCAQQFSTERGILPLKQKLWNYDKSFDNPCAIYPSNTLNKCEFHPISAAEYRQSLEQAKVCANRAYSSGPVRLLPRHLGSYAARGVSCIRVVPDVLPSPSPGCSARAPTATGCLDQSCLEQMDHRRLARQLSSFPSTTQ